ncbi:uncharacterized protein MONBRDRAFT_29295 [Monosiga brevicollis MX1]|uniref:Condensin complex subunit 1 C-terminal domain-containing protein n=1 Tax=Monosiga brevicollis TaxID=81824 RepID=A9VAP2_MONBE|nr:uncharacterized protein MONBRDRAFT_29295 [Monosiga brevicollis MX1]EDQ85357.1 predicted protein [Monosiga brevicollis MX1]|eukprot:XP_001749768.1 hypothetical protein [Monosiga brevicollis MX1]
MTTPGGSRESALPSTAGLTTRLFSRHVPVAPRETGASRELWRRGREEDMSAVLPAISARASDQQPPTIKRRDRAFLASLTRAEQRRLFARPGFAPLPEGDPSTSAGPRHLRFATGPADSISADEHVGSESLAAQEWRRLWQAYLLRHRIDVHHSDTGLGHVDRSASAKSSASLAPASASLARTRNATNKSGRRAQSKARSQPPPSATASEAARLPAPGAIPIRQKYRDVVQWDENTAAEALADLADSSDFVRANAACMHQGTYHATKRRPLPPPAILNRLKALLNDSSINVRREAALTLVAEQLIDRYTLGDDQQRTVALALLQHVMDDDPMILYVRPGLTTAGSRSNCPCVVIFTHRLNNRGMITQMLTDHDALRRRAAVELVHLLVTYYTQDIFTCLSTLLWEDENEAVQDAACAALVERDYGHMVHEELSRRLSAATERTRLAALRRLGKLRHVNSRLLDHVVHALKDEYSNVRLAACKALGTLESPTPKVIDALLTALEQDSNVSVRLEALRALDSLKVQKLRLKSCLLWLIQYSGDARLVILALELLPKLVATVDDSTESALLSRIQPSWTGVENIAWLTWTRAYISSQADKRPEVQEVLRICLDKLHWHPQRNQLEEHFEQIQHDLDCMSAKNSLMKTFVVPLFEAIFG